MLEDDYGLDKKLENYINVVNAKITEVDIILQRGYFLTVIVCFEYGHGSQCLTSYVLGKKRDFNKPKKEFLNTVLETENYTELFINSLMSVVEVDSFNDLKNKSVRVMLDNKDFYNAKIIGIANYLNDHKFFDVWEECNYIKDSV